MPTEIQIASRDGSRRYTLGYVQPGKDHPFTNLPSADGKIISVRCQDSNSLSEIYSFDNEVAAEDLALNGLKSHLYTEDNLVASLRPGESYERLLITKSRKVARLTLIHWASIE